MNINLKLNYFTTPLKFLNLSKKYAILYFLLASISEYCRQYQFCNLSCSS